MTHEKLQLLTQQTALQEFCCGGCAAIVNAGEVNETTSLLMNVKDSEYNSFGQCNKDMIAHLCLQFPATTRE